MRNSTLAVHTNLSPFRNAPRNRPIAKITPHHVAGDLSIESIGRIFTTPGRNASSHYGIGTDGRIGLYVNEADRAWTSSSAANDNQAVTFEVSNSSVGGDWPISDAAFNAMIDLCVDICRRNPGIVQQDGKTRGLWFNGTPNGSLTFHNMFAATSCPGPTIAGRAQEICRQVNARLTGPAPTPQPSTVRVAFGGTVTIIHAALENGAWMAKINNSGEKVRVRDILTTLGYDVDWDGNTQTILTNPRR